MSTSTLHRLPALALVFCLTATGVLAAGCGKKAVPVAAVVPPPPADTVPVGPPPPPSAPALAAAVTPPTASEEELFARMSLADLNSSQPLADVFFEYDSIDLGGDTRDLLQRNATWMRRWTSTAVLIEGHADERGTAEYNLSLGNHRADQVRAYLTSLGVDGTRVRVVSKGKEQPFCAGSGEDCWRQNRRGHFVIVAK